MSADAVQISVIIPTYHRPWQLNACLSELARQMVARSDCEVIVAQDGPGALSAENLAQSFPGLPLRLVTITHAGPAAARNAGAKVAYGRWLAFLDDDCVPSPDWLVALSICLRETPDCAIGGQTINALPGNPYAAASQALVDYLYSCFNLPEQATFFTSNNITLPAQLFTDLGGFDEHFRSPAAEDRDFCDRWRLAGLAMCFAPAVRVLHAHQLDLPGFARQHFNYGRGAYHYHQHRAARGSGAMRIQPPGFYLRLLQCAPGARMRLLLALTQIANATGYFYERVFHARGAG